MTLDEVILLYFVSDSCCTDHLTDVYLWSRQHIRQSDAFLSEPKLCSHNTSSMKRDSPPTEYTTHTSHNTQTGTWLNVKWVRCFIREVLCTFHSSSLQPIMLRHHLDSFISDVNAIKLMTEQHIFSHREWVLTLLCLCDCCLLQTLMMKICEWKHCSVKSVDKE